MFLKRKIVETSVMDYYSICKGLIYNSVLSNYSQVITA